MTRYLRFGYGYKDPQQPSPNGYCNLSKVTGFDFAKSLDGIATPKRCLSNSCPVEGGAYTNPDDHLAMEGGMCESEAVFGLFRHR